jgi:hypothetical protein
MGVCYWCYWGWPKPIRDIYDDCVSRVGESPLLYGPGHVVWADENWNSAQWCLDHFDEHVGDGDEAELAVARESLERLVALPDEFKTEPNGFDADEHDPADFPPPEPWECEKR